MACFNQISLQHFAQSVSVVLKFKIGFHEHRPSQQDADLKWFNVCYGWRRAWVKDDKLGWGSSDEEMRNEGMRGWESRDEGGDLGRGWRDRVRRWTSMRCCRGDRMEPGELRLGVRGFGVGGVWGSSQREMNESFEFKYSVQKWENLVINFIYIKNLFVGVSL